MAVRKVKGRPAARKKPPARTFVQRAVEMGAVGAALIDPRTVVTGEWVRWKCHFGCGGYGSNLMCPPYSPEPHQTRRMLDEYRQAVLFEGPHGKTKEIAAELERQVFLSGYYKTLGLGSGPCHLCDACAMEEGCRHPRQARPSMESCGIDVYATVRKHGFAIEVVRDHDDPQHYFGIVLID